MFYLYTVPNGTFWGEGDYFLDCFWEALKINSCWMDWKKCDPEDNKARQQRCSCNFLLLGSLNQQGGAGEYWDWLPALLKRETTRDLGTDSKRHQRPWGWYSVIKLGHKRLTGSLRAASRSPGCWKNRNVSCGSAQTGGSLVLPIC